MPRFAANLSFLYTELPFLERFAAAAEDGFKAVEFLYPYTLASAADIAQQLHTHGLTQALFNAPPGGTDLPSIEQAITANARGTAAIPGKEQEFRTGFELAMQYAQTLQCSQVHVMSGLQPKGLNREACIDTYIRNLRWASRIAAPLGIQLLVEALNPRDNPGYLVNTQNQAHDVIERVGAPNVKVQMDLYHCQIVEGDLATKLRQYLPTGKVSHIQIAGVPERHEPHIGEVNYPYLFQLIDELGYEGWIGCEYRPQAQTRAGLHWLTSLK